MNASNSRPTSRRSDRPCTRRARPEAEDRRVRFLGARIVDVGVDGDETVEREEAARALLLPPLLERGELAGLHVVGLDEELLRGRLGRLRAHALGPHGPRGRAHHVAGVRAAGLERREIRDEVAELLQRHVGVVRHRRVAVGADVARAFDEDRVGIEDRLGEVRGRMMRAHAGEVGPDLARAGLRERSYHAGQPRSRSRRRACGVRVTPGGVSSQPAARRPCDAGPSCRAAHRAYAAAARWSCARSIRDCSPPRRRARGARRDACHPF